MSKYKDGSYIIKDGVIYEVQIDFYKHGNVTTIPVSDFMKKTNADRIRNMTDEKKLADHILGYLFDEPWCTFPHCICANRCDECLAEWLKQEAEE